MHIKIYTLKRTIVVRQRQDCFVTRARRRVKAHVLLRLRGRKRAIAKSPSDSQLTGKHLALSQDLWIGTYHIECTQANGVLASCSEFKGDVVGVVDGEL